ncbi:hypothetical protein K469DRAFT_697650 [Zopfia rhizophila CBS 207.26]|uniref:Uncharacterized protein n=1 Tax=Zopfia rhizophila CBS 207.26 TaxID=1314779 RepID=A0A6A6EHP2_9PEZI|nr:hypothetical protein K469DRAFT_697650 [Zopfia rhizophila CBS 207.26]
MLIKGPDTQTHTHTHTQRERERERERDNDGITLLPPDQYWDEIAELTGDPSWSHWHMRSLIKKLERDLYVPRETPDHGFDRYLGYYALSRGSAAALGPTERAKSTDFDTVARRYINHLSTDRDSEADVYQMPFKVDGRAFPVQQYWPRRVIEEGQHSGRRRPARALASDLRITTSTPSLQSFPPNSPFLSTAAPSATMTVFRWVESKWNRSVSYHLLPEIFKWTSGVAKNSTSDIYAYSLAGHTTGFVLPRGPYPDIFYTYTPTILKAKSRNPVQRSHPEDQRSSQHATVNFEFFHEKDDTDLQALVQGLEIVHKAYAAIPAPHTHWRALSWLRD